MGNSSHVHLVLGMLKYGILIIGMIVYTLNHSSFSYCNWIEQVQFFINIARKDIGHTYRIRYDM